MNGFELVKISLKYKTYHSIETFRNFDYSPNILISPCAAAM